MEKAWRTIALRDRMGLPMRIPICFGAGWCVEELDYKFGRNSLIDPDAFYDEMKVDARRLKSRTSYVRHGLSWIQDT